MEFLFAHGITHYIMLQLLIGYFHENENPSNCRRLQTWTKRPRQKAETRGRECVSSHITKFGNCFISQWDNPRSQKKFINNTVHPCFLKGPQHNTGLLIGDRHGNDLRTQEKYSKSPVCSKNRSPVLSLWSARSPQEKITENNNSGSQNRRSISGVFAQDFQLNSV